MATPVIMPALGMAQDTGRIVRWLKEEGASVQAGEPIMEIETDKVNVEIEAPVSGTLVRIQAPAGSEVPVGEVVAWIGAPDEEPAADTALSQEAAEGASVAPAQEAPRPTPVAARLAAEHNVPLEAIPATGRWIRKEDVLAYVQAQHRPQAAPSPAPSPRVAASPKARRLAQEHGIDLSHVPGSGPEGAVLATDVLAYIQARQAARAAPPSFWDRPLWQSMAQRVTQSWQQVPHFYLEREVRANRLQVWRQKAQDRLDLKVTYTDLLVKLVAAALREHPYMNAVWDDNAPRPLESVNVAIAVATEDGLVVPVIHNADRLNLAEIARRRADLVQRAQTNSLRLEDVQNGGFTITNLGMYRVDAFHPIVNTPQIAILAVGQIQDRPIVESGHVTVCPMIRLVLACDHRAVDGARAATFLDTLVAFIEEPLALLQ